MNNFQQEQIAKLNAIRPSDVNGMTEFNQLFNNMEFGNIRTLTDPNGNPWFVGKDIALALGYVDTKKAVARHCKGEHRMHPIQTSQGIQNIRIVSEGDMYRLVGGSQLPSAQRFESWVYDVVLPTIRKHGMYNNTLIDKESFMQKGLQNAYDTCIALDYKADEADNNAHESEQARIAAEVDLEMLEIKYKKSAHRIG